MEEAIICEGISKKYKLYNKPIDRLKESLNPFRKKYSNSFSALDDVSFVINRGETVGIVGKNGSGKSTLLKIITGVLTPSSGKMNIACEKISSILELGAGFNMEYTGLENIYLYGTLIGYNKSEMDSRLESILKFADIGEFINQPVKSYSSGMFARLAFAVSVSVEPDLLIVDEALAVGDIKFQTKCFNKFRELKENGVTILFVSHDVYSIRQFCDRAMWIHQGKLKMLGDTVEVTSKYVEHMNVDSSADNNDLINEIYTENNITRSEFNPLNRWGSHVGSIIYANIYNKDGYPTDVMYVGESIKVKMIFKVPLNISLKNFSCAFSIKSTQGLDLIVSTTYDDKTVFFDEKLKGYFVEVIFEFNNYINTGDFVLNVALENREESVPNYYDYIEGAQYIKSINNKQQFGMINIPVNQSIQKKEGILL